MPIEGTVNRIEDLDPRWPRNADIVREGAQHLRNIKTALRQYVEDEVGTVKMFYGALADIPVGWAVCDGQNGTPNMLGRVPVGAGGAYALNDFGGVDTVTLTTAQMPPHGHAGETENGGVHSHGGSVGNGGAHGHTGTTDFEPDHTHGIPSGSSDTSRGGNDYANDGDMEHTTPAGGHSHQLNISNAPNHTHPLTINNSPAHKHTVTVGNTGGGESHENRMPYRALFFIMKVEA